MRQRISQRLKYDIGINSNAVCHICGENVLFSDDIEIDHIFPVSMGGRSVKQNLQCVHKKCNRFKGGKNIMSNPEQWKIWWDLIEPNLHKLRSNQLEAFNFTLKRVIDSNSSQGTLTTSEFRNKEYGIYPGCRPKIYCECTGAGKSILMIVLGFLLSRKRILIITPSKVILDNNSGAVSEACKLGVIPQEVKKNVKVLSMNQSNSGLIMGLADIVVTTYQKMGKSGANRLLSTLKGDEFDVILVDEAHHYQEDNLEDTTHKDIIKKFNKAIILFFTATPFDSKLDPILSNFDKNLDVVHEFTYKEAWQKGYVKYVEWVVTRPESQDILKTHPNGKAEAMKLLTADEITKYKKTEPGYKTALSKSDPAQLALITATIQFLDQRNRDLKNIAHKNIALFILPSIESAKNAANLLSKMGTQYKHCVITSDVPDYDIIMKDIKNDVYDIIFAVGILKEGFDQKNITIVTLCRNISTYLFFSQVIGRGVRARKGLDGNYIPVSGKDEIGKDICFVITHEHLDLHKMWELFKEMDLGNLTDSNERLFVWENIQNNDKARLLSVLKFNYGIECDTETEIIKNDDKSLAVLKSGNNNIKLQLSPDNTELTITNNDNTIAVLDVEKEKDCLGIYEPKTNEDPKGNIERTPCFSPKITITSEKYNESGLAEDGFSDGDLMSIKHRASNLKRAAEINKNPVVRDWMKAMPMFALEEIMQQELSVDFCERLGKQGSLNDFSEQPVNDFAENLQILRTTLWNILATHLRKSTGYKPSANYMMVKDISKSISITFIEIYKHPLSLGTTNKGFKQTPEGVSWLESNLPGLIDKYTSFDYFKTEFLPTCRRLNPTIFRENQ